MFPRKIVILNPNLKGHKLLGGAFYSKSFDDKISKNLKFNQLWLWNCKNDEKLLLDRIYKIFIAEWKKQGKRGDGY